MTLAKARGGNQVEVYRRGIREARREHARLEADLARAIETGRIELYFQPVVDLVTGQIHGAEALARWFDPDRGAVSPAVFVPIAESSGLILALGDLVLERACEAAARLSRRVPGFVVNVNVSGQQLAEHNFPAGVRQTLRRTGCSPTALVLELTETAFVGDLDRADDRLRELRALGLRVAIDDFGTGYSSLSYLRRLPADVVKIDRSFVTAIGEGLEVLEAMMTLAHSMGLTVVAEGIETPDQLKALTRLRCDLGQGYLFAQPMSLLELTTLLDQPDPRPSWWTDGLGEPQLALWSPL
jgi:EAL domain-containing protein (putative c-di-GMP-specific phosphodiesterase class I)